MKAFPFEGRATSDNGRKLIRRILCRVRIQGNLQQKPPVRRTNERLDVLMKRGHSRKREKGKRT